MGARPGFETGTSHIQAYFAMISFLPHLKVSDDGGNGAKVYSAGLAISTWQLG